MVHLFFVIGFCGLCIFFMWVIKQHYYAWAIGIILTMNLVGSAILWGINTEKKIDTRLERIESISNNVKDTVYAIDKIGGAGNSIAKGANNAGKALDSVDKTIEDKYKNLVDRLWGKKE